VLLPLNVSTLYSENDSVKSCQNITVYRQTDRQTHTTLNSDVDGEPQFFLKAQKEKLLL